MFITPFCNCLRDNFENYNFASELATCFYSFLQFARMTERKRNTEREREREWERERERKKVEKQGTDSEKINIDA